MIVSKHHVAPPARNKKNIAIIHTLGIKQKHLNLYTKIPFIAMNWNILNYCRVATLIEGRAL